MAVLLEALVQAVAGGSHSRGPTRAVVIFAPVVILTVVYLLSR
jgi:hypothetical protein